MGRDSAVGIATGYRLDGPGIESRWGARFSAPVQTGPGAHPASCTKGTGSFSGVKRPAPGAIPPPTSSVPSYTSARPKGLGSLYWENLYLYLLNYLCDCRNSIQILFHVCSFCTIIFRRVGEIYIDLCFLEFSLFSLYSCFFFFLQILYTLGSVLCVSCSEFHSIADETFILL